jgi:hypothetical protein
MQTNITVRTALLALEFFLLCVVLPTCIIVFRLAPFMFFFLWAAALYCWFFVLRRENFLKDVWKWEAVTWVAMRPILIRWVCACAAMTVFIYFVDPARMFDLFLERPYFVLLLFCLYPVLSALPQEMVFCSFFFRRYAPFFTTERSMVIASALIFAYAHVLFINWIAPLLSVIAGYIFAKTYSHSRSLALVTIEHALYGNYLFFVGLGWYFYGGAVH